MRYLLAILVLLSLLTSCRATGERTAQPPPAEPERIIEPERMNF